MKVHELDKQPSPTSLSPTIGPTMSSTVHLGLTITFTSLYGLLFLLIIWQLLLILYYKHRRLSYQTLFLFTCLIWAGLRTTLFSFYFKNAVLSNLLSPFAHWFLFAFPVYLQYNMLSILLVYFVLVLAKMLIPTKVKTFRRKVFITIFISNVIFLTANISCSVVYSFRPNAPYQQTVTYIRVSINYSIFLIAALVLCYCIIKLTRISSAKIFLEGQGVSLCQAVAVCTLIALLFITRAVYNILAVSPIYLPSFNFGWINVSDQGEVSTHGTIAHTTDSYAFVSFGCVLFVWELLPTFTTVWFFRVRIMDRTSTSTIKSDSFHTKSYFFDNPNRYDSDDDLSMPYTPVRSVNGGLADIPRFGQSIVSVSATARTNTLQETIESRAKIASSYGSVPPFNGSYSSPKDPNHRSPHIRGTTPPILFPRGGSASNLYQPFTEEPES